MKIKQLLTAVLSETDASNLSKQFTSLQCSNRNYVSYEDMLNLIQDSIVYSLNKKYEITSCRLNTIVRHLLINFIKHKKVIDIVSLTDIDENNIIL
jgi:hypothetical protein